MLQAQTSKQSYTNNVTYRLLCKYVLSSMFVTCDLRVLTVEFYVLRFRFCVLCYIFWHVRLAFFQGAIKYIKEIEANGKTYVLFFSFQFVLYAAL